MQLVSNKYIHSLRKLAWSEDHSIPQHDVVRTWAPRDAPRRIAGQSLEVSDEATTAICGLNGSCSDFTFGEQVEMYHRYINQQREETREESGCQRLWLVVKTIKRLAYALLIQRLRRLDLSLQPPALYALLVQNAGRESTSVCGLIYFCNTLALIAARIKNRAPAAIQVTAEQLLRDVRYKSRSGHRINAAS